MIKFETLPYLGKEITCRHCEKKTFFSNYSRIRLEKSALFQWYYQCQQCGLLKMSDLDSPCTEFLERRCDCGGQFRRDKPLFCAHCLVNKTVHNTNE